MQFKRDELPVFDVVEKGQAEIVRGEAQYELALHVGQSPERPVVENQNVPVEHAKQLFWSTPPVVFLKEPPEQFAGVTVPASQYLPSGHSSQSA